MYPRSRWSARSAKHQISSMHPFVSFIISAWMSYRPVFLLRCYDSSIYFLREENTREALTEKQIHRVVNTGAGLARCDPICGCACSKRLYSGSDKAEQYT